MPTPSPVTCLTLLWHFPSPFPPLTCKHSAGTSRSLRESVQEFNTTFRWSAGAGLVVPTWFGRFEANYVWVLSHQELDRTKRGLQLGFVASAL